MKLSKALLSAMVVGLTVQTTGCKTNDPTPKGEEGKKTESGSGKTPVNCPGCGMG